MSAIRRTFIEGVVVLTPIFILGAVVWWTYVFLSSLPLIAFIEPPILRASLVLVLFVLSIFSLGYLMRTAVGQLLDQLVHNLINRFPIIRVIYNAVKLTLDTILTRSDSIQRPVKIEVWEGCRMTAFETGHQTADGRVLIFIPGAPEVTSGFVAEVDPDRLIETNETLMDVLVRLISCGFGEAETHER